MLHRLLHKRTPPPLSSALPHVCHKGQYFQMSFFVTLTFNWLDFPPGWESSAAILGHSGNGVHLTLCLLKVIPNGFLTSTLKCGPLLPPYTASHAGWHIARAPQAKSNWLLYSKPQPLLSVTARLPKMLTVLLSDVSTQYLKHWTFSWIINRNINHSALSSYLPQSTKLWCQTQDPATRPLWACSQPPASLSLATSKAIWATRCKAWWSSTLQCSPIR